MFIFRFSGGYAFNGSPNWCYFLAAVIAQCEKKCWCSLALNLELRVDMLTRVLTVVGLKTSRTKTVHIYTLTLC